MIVDIGIKRADGALMLKIDTGDGHPLIMECPMRKGEPYAPHVDHLLGRLELMAKTTKQEMVNPATGKSWTVGEFREQIRARLLRDGYIWEAS